MPRPKGDLSAIMAILGLLVAGPDTQAKLNARFKQEFPDGNWSRSAVHSSLTSLAEQGLILLTLVGAKPSENLYEATPTGLTVFKEWLWEAVRQPPPLREPMQLWLEHSTEADLPEMLKLIDELKRDATNEFAKAQALLNSTREVGDLGSADGSDWQGRVLNAILSERVMIWGHRAVRAKKLRERLKQTRELHTPIPEDEDDDG